MKSINIGKIYVLIILSNICNMSIGQNYSTEEIPNPYSAISTAELHTGSENSLTIIGISGTTVSGVYDTTKSSLFIISRDENGFTNDYTVIETGKSIGYGFGGSEDIFNVTVDKNQSGRFLVAWTKQNRSYGDIVNRPEYFESPVLNIGTWDENTFIKMYEFHNEDNPQIKSDSYNFHLVRQSVSPLKTQHSESDSNYYYTTSEILYNKIFSDGTIDSTIHIGSGFFPQIHVGKNGNIHFFWLSADSSNSKYFRLMYLQRTKTGFETAITIKDSVSGQWDENYNIHDYPINYFSFVDDSGKVFAGWTDNNVYNKGRIFFARLSPDGTVKIDTLGNLHLRGSQATFKVSFSGKINILWRTYQNNNWTFHFTQSLSTDSLFTTIRSYENLYTYYDNPIIYINNMGVANGIFTTPGPKSVSYFKDLLSGPDTTYVIAPGAVTYGFNPARTERTKAKSFDVDQSGQMWLLATNGSTKLVKFDLQPTNLENSNVYPANISLSQNFPNPFNPQTNIRFYIPKTEFVEINIFNIMGQNVKSFGKNKYMLGTHQIVFDGSIFASGIYFIQMKAGNFTDVKKMVLVK